MTGSADFAAIIAAMIRSTGVSLDEVIAALGQSTAASADTPTIAEFLPEVEQRCSDASARTYRAGWRRLVDGVGDKPVQSVTVGDLEAIAIGVRREAGARSTRGDGRGAEENFVAAARFYFERAVRSGLITHNPAKSLRKPARGKSRRRALTEAETAELWKVAAVGSNDPELDRLLIRFHLETGARRAGAVNLLLGEIDPRRQTIWLHEKGGREREQPVSATLIQALLSHAHDRGDGRSDGPVFFYRRRADGTQRPLTRRRYNTLFPRLQRLLPWAATIGLDAHTLRHTAITWVERTAGFEVARAFAGHSENEVTSTYAKATLEEIAAAVAHLTGEPHPLALDGLSGHAATRQQAVEISLRNESR